jgi:hypothetical protein
MPKPKGHGMTDKNIVMRSIETDDGIRCVDIFRRPNGTFGFEEYRRDVEDGRGWYRIGYHAEKVYETSEQALGDAIIQISWLGSVIQ